jgi:tetratricopeptide (TPR) repeat protein
MSRHFVRLVFLAFALMCAGGCGMLAELGPAYPKDEVDDFHGAAKSIEGGLDRIKLGLAGMRRSLVASLEQANPQEAQQVLTKAMGVVEQVQALPGQVTDLLKAGEKLLKKVPGSYTGPNALHLPKKLGLLKEALTSLASLPQNIRSVAASAQAVIDCAAAIGGSGDVSVCDAARSGPPAMASTHSRPEARRQPARGPDEPAGEVLDLEAEDMGSVDDDEMVTYGLEGNQAQVLLDEGLRLADDDEHLSGALRFDDIVENADPASPAALAARFALGVSLYELGLHQSALLQFEPIVEAGEDHPRFRQTLRYLLFIARATDGDASVLGRIAAYDPEMYPPDFRDELHFLVGQHLFSEGNPDDALDRFAAVTNDDAELFVRARYLAGVIHVQLSRLQVEPERADAEQLKQAAQAFKAILRLQRTSGSSETMDRVSAMATLALGRLFFSTRQYAVAVRYYDKLTEVDGDWLDSLFEVSWVYFQLKNYPRALGNLHTLNSPFFTDQYFPESRVLQALILFYNCRYDEADDVVQAFVQDYYALMTELKGQIGQFEDPNAFYRWLARLSKGGESEFSGRFTRIFNAALADKRLRRKFFFVTTLNKELLRIRATAKERPAAEPFLASLEAELTGYRSLVVGEAGALAQARLQRVLRELKQHLAGALKIKGETLKARRGVLADSVRVEQAAAAAADTTIVVDPEHLEWPFEGEYWRDELGSYRYDISSRCGDGGS